jgi:hypothetical protein
MFKTRDMPGHIRALPRDRKGRPIPYFVDRSDGNNDTPDFRVADERRLHKALWFGLCWVCGQPRMDDAAFVIGPMCAVNRVSAEPPCHTDCAVYSARFCPFLTRPSMIRRERGLPVDKVDPPGVMIARNPGVALVWRTRTHTSFTVDGGVLFNVGEPIETLWFAEGKPATHADVMASIESGMPLLREAADKDGPLAHADLDERLQAALRYVPAAS